MNQKGIFKLCKELGCCDSCCLRYLGTRFYNAYEDPKAYSLQFQENPTNTENVSKLSEPTSSTTDTSDVLTDCKSKDNVANESSSIDNSNDTISKATTENTDVDVNMEVTNSISNEEAVSSNRETVPTNGEAIPSNGEADKSDRTGSPQPKRRKVEICVSCLGLLQQDGWKQSNEVVKEVLDKKQYDCKSFGCGLSSPITTMVREKVILLTIKDAFPDFDEMSVTTLNKAWKCAYGPQLARFLGITYNSGDSPLLLVLNMEYPDDQQELEVLKSLAPGLFLSRRRQRARFRVEFTRRCVEQALESATLDKLSKLNWARAPPATARASCVSVTCTRAPVYLGGRYIKLSRELPQTPWVVLGKRMMDSSVQEIIFEPIAKICGMTEADIDHRLKFMSAGREDVDVRCLGTGRPFAIEITDPRRELTEEELEQICETVSSGKKVVIKKLVPVTKEDLALLKSGEETKTKTYEALCIKLAHSEGSNAGPDEPVTVTDEDIAALNSFRNTPAGAPERIALRQKTPLRVLHRRPLLTRTKYVLDLTAAKVPEHPQLLVLRLRTSAGAYVKELVHGELRRTAPALAAAARAPLDILALDVTTVQLDWPQ